MRTPQSSFFIQYIQNVGAVASAFLMDLGSLVHFAIETFLQIFLGLSHKRLPFRRETFFLQCMRAGVLGVPLVFFISMFIGLTMALLTGDQLQRYGTEKLVPGLLTVSFVRELGPLLTGIVLAARSGAAFTAELSTMTVNEEVDAIEAMGIGPLRYLVAPRVLALFLLFPSLSIVSSISGLLGAALICRLQFHIPYLTFTDLARDQLLVQDMVVGVIKSFLFGGLIAWIACYKGLSVRGGSEEVGRATTASVVISITTVIGLDMLCNLVVTKLLP